MLDQENILKEFPNIKLSYENIVYKKVYSSDVILAIPEGKKCFAWFTTYNDKNVCFIMETKNKQIQNVRITNASFSSELSYGTILYGTTFYHKKNNNRFFAIEDIFYHKGRILERETWGNKFTILKTLFSTDLKQIAYNNSFIVFGLPLFSSNMDDLLTKIKSVTYAIASIQFRLYNRFNNYLVMPYKNSILNDEPNLPTKNNNSLTTNNKPNETKYENRNPPQRNILKREVVFMVKPDIQNDIYHLYCLNNALEEEYYNIAHIPDYKTSVFMNGLFREIKENSNLDALEESDDEEEFENEKEDKFVHLERNYNIICSYNYKFKKWVPIKLAESNPQIVFMKELPNIERK